jgi:hypothetical protein
MKTTMLILALIGVGLSANAKEGVERKTRMHVRFSPCEELVFETSQGTFTMFKYHAMGEKFDRVTGEKIESWFRVFESIRLPNDTKTYVTGWPNFSGWIFDVVEKEGKVFVLTGGYLKHFRVFEYVDNRLKWFQTIEGVTIRGKKARDHYVLSSNEETKFMGLLGYKEGKFEVFPHRNGMIDYGIEEVSPGTLSIRFSGTTLSFNISERRFGYYVKIE